MEDVGAKAEKGEEALEDMLMSARHMVSALGDNSEHAHMRVEHFMQRWQRSSEQVSDALAAHDGLSHSDTSAKDEGDDERLQKAHAEQEQLDAELQRVGTELKRFIRMVDITAPPGARERNG
jgi:U3 small nucleolar ribonucleoprotein component